MPEPRSDSLARQALVQKENDVDDYAGAGGGDSVRADRGVADRTGRALAAQPTVCGTCGSDRPSYRWVTPFGGDDANVAAWADKSGILANPDEDWYRCPDPWHSKTKGLVQTHFDALSRAVEADDLDGIALHAATLASIADPAGCLMPSAGKDTGEWVVITCLHCGLQDPSAVTPCMERYEPPIFHQPVPVKVVPEARLDQLRAALFQIACSPHRGGPHPQLDDPTCPRCIAKKALDQPTDGGDE